MNVRSDVRAPFQLLASGSTLRTPADFEALNKRIECLMKKRYQGVRYVLLDLNSVRFELLNNSSFANAKVIRSKRGYGLLLVEDKEYCNVLDYGSKK